MTLSSSRFKAGGHGSVKSRLSHYRHALVLDALVLDDGDILRWLVVDRPGASPRVAYYRCDRRRGMHPSQGLAILRAARHRDADLEQRTDEIGRWLRH